MGSIDAVSVIGGFVFAGYVVISTSYWSDAQRWCDIARALSDSDWRQRARKYSKRAELIFRLSAGVGLISLVLTILPVYTSDEALGRVIGWLMLGPLGILVVLVAVIAITRRYFVPIDMR